MLCPIQNRRDTLLFLHYSDYWIFLAAALVGFRDGHETPRLRESTVIEKFELRFIVKLLIHACSRGCRLQQCARGVRMEIRLAVAVALWEST